MSCVISGSCNGLQHYAALGLDANGGAQVNLSPSPEPQDVYSGVCDVVKKKVSSRVTRWMLDVGRYRYRRTSSGCQPAVAELDQLCETIFDIWLFLLSSCHLVVLVLLLADSSGITSPLAP